MQTDLEPKISGPAESDGSLSKQGFMGPLRSALSGLKYFLMQLMYGPGTDTGTSNEFVYDTTEGLWKRENPRPDQVHETDFSHPHAGQQALGASGVPFAGVFGKKSAHSSRTQVDMNALAHPVYAPRVDIYTNQKAPDVQSLTGQPIEQIVARKSPFG